MALQDPLYGPTVVGQRQQRAEAQWLDAHYHGGDILASTAAFDPMIFYTGLPNSDFISDGDGSYFHQAVARPQDYAEWIVMDQHNNNFEAVWSALHVRTDWRRYYALRTTIGSTLIYQRITPPTGSATATRAPLALSARLARQPGATGGRAPDAL